MTNEPVWTEWLENLGNGDKPVPDFSEDYQVWFDDGFNPPFATRDWGQDNFNASVITHYRYAVPADLAWLANRVYKWSAPKHFRIWKTGPPWIAAFWYEKPESCEADGYTKSQWLRARRDLGYEAQGDYVPGKMSMPRWGRGMGEKQARYIDDNGEDWIDEFARTATPEEFRGAMRFTIGKYNRRAGKKDDLVKEIRKMRDYCDRWLEYEGGVRDDLLSA